MKTTNFLDYREWIGFTRIGKENAQVLWMGNWAVNSLNNCGESFNFGTNFIIVCISTTRTAFNSLPGIFIIEFISQKKFNLKIVRLQIARKY